MWNVAGGSGSSSSISCLSIMSLTIRDYSHTGYIAHGYRRMSGPFGLPAFARMTVVELRRGKLPRRRAWRRPNSFHVQSGPMDKTFMLIGAVAAFIGVGFGAFGAHGLRGRLSPEMLAVFETAVRYQMYHAFALLITALALARFDGWLIRAAGWSFAAGIVL